MLLFFIGLVSGMLGGMGIGGGTIQIPSLIFLVGVSQHTAQGINLASFIPTALAAIIFHSRNKRIRQTGISTGFIRNGRRAYGFPPGFLHVSIFAEEAVWRVPSCYWHI